MEASDTDDEALRSMRRRAGLTQTELAGRVGTTQSAVARWERGSVAPSLSSLRRLAGACGYRVAIEPVDDDASVVTDDEVARLEANVRLSPEQRLARAATAANFVLRARRATATATARDGRR